MAKRVIEDATLTAIADAVRDNSDGTLEGVTMMPSQMPEMISEVVVGAFDRGESQGWENGHSEGYDNGYSEGYTFGYEDGLLSGDYDTGYQDGFYDGHADGYDIGFYEGRDEGFEDGQASTDALLSDADIGDYYNDRITRLGTYALYYRTTMRTLHLPNLEDGSSGCVGQCSNLVEVRFPGLKFVQSANWFTNCSKLEMADLGHANQLSSGTFQNCSSLETLVLRRTGTSGTALPLMNALSGTPDTEDGSGGTVYVPSAMIEWYQNATNWGYLWANGTVDFVPLEGSEYE